MAGSSAWQPELKRAWSAKCVAAVRSILLSPRGSKIAAATDAGVHLFDGPPSYARRSELAGGPAGVTAAAFGAQGTDVVAGGADGFLKWWQVDSGEELCSTQFPLGDGAAAAAASGGGILEVACSKGGLVAAASGRLLCIFGPGGEHLHTLDASGDGSLQHVTWLDGSSVLGCCGSEATIWRVDGEQYEEVGAFGANPAGAITKVSMSPDGHYLAAACDNSTVQIWDTRLEGSMDPVLCIAEGIGGPVAALSWDSASRLLAAAVGSEALVWDVGGALEGSPESSFICIGFDKDAKVDCLTFQPNGTLLAAADDKGLCLIWDSATFGAGSVASGLVTNVASGRLGDGSATPEGSAEGEGDAAAAADTGAVVALAWHSTGSLLLGTSTGAVGALQPLRAAGAQRAASTDSQTEPAAAPAAAAAAQQAESRSGSVSPAPQPAAAAGAAAPKASASPPPPPRGRPAGWGGEPLSINGGAGSGTSSGAEHSDGQPMGGMGGRGRGGGRGMRGGRYGPSMQPYAPHYSGPREGGLPGPKPPPGGLMAPGAGGMGPEQAQMMQAAAAAQWGMMPAAMAPHMWRQMGMSYAMTPYGQMMAVPQMPGMAAPAIPGYPAAMAGVMPQQMAQPGGGGRGAPYGPRPTMGGPMGGRSRGAGGQMGGYAGAPDAGGGGGGRGAPGGGAAQPYARRASGPPSVAGGERMQRRESVPTQSDREGSPQASGGDLGQEQQHHHHHAQQPQQQAYQQQQHHHQQPQQPAAAGARPQAGGAPQRSVQRGGGGSGGSGDHWQHMPDTGRSGGGPVHSQPQAAPAAQAQGVPAAMAASGMMARPPYGMAPVYMFPQAGMMPAWGMYPGQMAAFPTPGGYVMYPAAAAYGTAAAQASALTPQTSVGGASMSGAQDEGRKDGAGRSGGAGGGGPRHGGGYEAGGYPRASDYSGSGYSAPQQQGPLATLYVGNLAPTVDETALIGQFEQFGRVETVQVIRDRETQEPKGYAFITFAAEATGAAQAAMARLHNTALPGAFAGRVVRVSPSNKWRGGGGAGGGGGAAAAGGDPSGAGAHLAAAAAAAGMGAGR